MSRVFTVRDEITVRAPIERCFALSTSIEIVRLTLGMRPVRGCTTGCVTDGAKVLWRGWKFCLPQMHESLIEAFDPPRFFRDRMLRGRFAAFVHDHSFSAQPDGSVLLSDELQFSLPCGAIGTLVSSVLVLPHIRSLLRERFVLIKRLAESDGWQAYLA